MKNFWINALILLINFVEFILFTKVGHFLFIMLFGGLIITIMSTIIGINASSYIGILAIPAILFAIFDDNKDWI